MPGRAGTPTPGEQASRYSPSHLRLGSCQPRPSPYEATPPRSHCLLRDAGPQSHPCGSLALSPWERCFSVTFCLLLLLGRLSQLQPLAPSHGLEFTSARPQARSPPFLTCSAPLSQPGPLLHDAPSMPSTRALLTLGAESVAAAVTSSCSTPLWPLPSPALVFHTVPYTCVLPSSQDESLQWPPVRRAPTCPTVSNYSSSGRDVPSDCLTRPCPRRYATDS